MLIIRSEQMTVFKATVKRAFEDEMVEHLALFSPPLFKAIAEEQMRKVVHFGIERAGSRGFTFRGPVRLYLELMLLFGSHFDTDPQYPWATEILKNRASGLQMQRADLLYERTLDYRQRVAGPEDTHTRAALKRISLMASQPPSMALEIFAPAMLREFAHLYPQKAAYVGDEGLEALIMEGQDLARHHKFLTVRGVAMVVLLMLGFGHGCCNDPLYPWIARALNNKTITDPEARARRLESKALTWLDHTLAYFENGAPA